MIFLFLYWNRMAIQQFADKLEVVNCFFSYVVGHCKHLNWFHGKRHLHRATEINKFALEMGQRKKRFNEFLIKRNHFFVFISNFLLTTGKSTNPGIILNKKCQAFPRKWITFRIWIKKVDLVCSFRLLQIWSIVALSRYVPVIKIIHTYYAVFYRFAKLAVTSSQQPSNCTSYTNTYKTASEHFWWYILYIFLSANICYWYDYCIATRTICPSLDMT